MRRFTVSHIYDENEAENAENHNDTDEQVSGEEDDVEYHAEDTDTSDESNEEVTSAEAAPTFAERFKFESG